MSLSLNVNVSLTVSLNPVFEALVSQIAEALARAAADLTVLTNALTSDEQADHAKIAELQAQVDALKVSATTPEDLAAVAALDDQIKALTASIAPPAPPVS